MSNSNAVSNVLGSFGGQWGLVNTGMGMKNADETFNVSGTLQGIAATTESQFALAGKSYGPVQTVIGAWGIYNVYDQVKGNYQATGNIQVTGAQWSSLAGNGLNVAMGVTKSTPLGAGLGVVFTGIEYAFNLTTSSQSTPSIASYSNEGRNYKTQTYNFGPNYRGYGFTDPRILDTSESYRSLNPTNSASINQASQTPGSGVSGGAWNIDGGGTSGVGGSTVQPGSMTNTAPNQGPGWSTPVATPDRGSEGGDRSSAGDFGGYNGFAGNTTEGSDFGRGEYGGALAPIVIDLDGDGVEIKPLSRSSTSFDADSDGYKDRSAWAGADDGLLVIDLDGDGQVTQSKEIAFGEWTSEEDTDLQALAKVFDSHALANRRNDSPVTQKLVVDIPAENEMNWRLAA